MRNQKTAHSTAQGGYGSLVQKFESTIKTVEADWLVCRVQLQMGLYN